jgi:hypothetical protein
MPNAISVEVIATKILFIRGKRVMLDRDLARLYGVSVKVLNQAVKRNAGRFPEDFMYQLTWQEVTTSRSQFVTLNSRCQSGTLKKGQNIKYLPYVFTEQGVAMLSSVLNSERAIAVNIQIMRAFVQLRRMLLTNRDLRRKIEEMEKKYDKQFAIVFQAIKQLLEPPPSKPKPAIGFHT